MVHDFGLFTLCATIDYTSRVTSCTRLQVFENVSVDVWSNILIFANLDSTVTYRDLYIKFIEPLDLFTFISDVSYNTYPSTTQVAELLTDITSLVSAAYELSELVALHKVLQSSSNLNLNKAYDTILQFQKNNYLTFCTAVLEIIKQ